MKAWPVTRVTGGSETAGRAASGGVCGARSSAAAPAGIAGAMLPPQQLRGACRPSTGQQCMRARVVCAHDALAQAAEAMPLRAMARTNSSVVTRRSMTP